MSYCSKFGAVNNFYFYQNRWQGNYYLVEFKTSFAASSLLRAVAQSQRNEVALKLLSHFLVFSPNNKFPIGSDAPNQRVPVQRGGDATQNLSAIVQRQDNLDGYVQQLYERTRLDELATRLRFIAALQIETMVSCMFPAVKALPFGSSVNGFGRMGSDLDVVLSLEQMPVSNDVPMKFSSREPDGSERSQNLNILQTITRLMENWMPGVSNMQPILNAKVPIIKYKQSFLDLDVDLSANNL